MDVIDLGEKREAQQMRREATESEASAGRVRQGLQEWVRENIEDLHEMELADLRAVLLLMGVRERGED